MIIDFHTHTFPDRIAEKAIAKLSDAAKAKNYLNGTAASLSESGKEAGIDLSVILPVATNAGQFHTINETAFLVNERTEETGLLSFGSLHPENENYREIIRDLTGHGVKGIKLHPVYQGCYVDDIRMLRIIECAEAEGMITIIHAGFDIGFPGQDFAGPEHILKVVEELKPKRFVLAHMGGWGCWEEAAKLLSGTGVYVDTSFTLTPLRDKGSGIEINTERTEAEMLSPEGFLKLVSMYGEEQILFGSDSPWSSQAEAKFCLEKTGFSAGTLDKILGKNAEKLLNL